MTTPQGNGIETVQGGTVLENSSGETQRLRTAVPLPILFDAPASVMGLVTLTASGSGPFKVQTGNVPAFRVVSDRVDAFQAFYGTTISGSAAGTAKTWGQVYKTPNGPPADGELFIIAEAELDPGTVLSVSWQLAVGPAT